ncbi:MAG: hypothetical protein BWK79_10540 [Beggiatoa sp. IS2]|nr:MAG: hypothetical protein BWK79_10540 [Beggiatoa sp. IS2]
MFEKINYFCLVFLKIIGLLFIIHSLIHCTSAQKPSPIALPEPLRSPTETKDILTTALETEQTTLREEPQTRFQTTPKAPLITSRTAYLEDESTTLPVFSHQAPVRVNIEGLPLPAFINEVFGNLLGLSFEIAPELQNKKELVTLRINEAQPPAQLYTVVQQVLKNYSVGIQKQGDLSRFVPLSQQQATSPSLVATGATLPEVPPSHRPIFQFIPLKVVNTADVISWLQTLFTGHDLRILQDPSRNSIIIMGMPQLVNQAAKAIEVLDQPLLRGQRSLRIEPAFLSAQELTDQLTKVLQNQGYGIPGTITLLPLPATNSVIVFASEASILAHVQQWALQLDQVNLQNQATEKQNLFFYAVKNTEAEPLAEVINKVLSQVMGDSGSQSSQTPTVPVANPAVTTSPVKKTAQYGQRLAVDEYRNGLLFFGTREEWAQLLPILRDMDKPSKQVLIEATIAEITLSDQDQRGIAWVINRANLGGLEGRLTSGALNIGGSGLTYTLSSAGQVRAVLNAFASSNRVTILSTPRLMVRSGSEASIDVGTEVPTLTSQATSPDLQAGGTSAILQQVQYRSTGVSLSVKPVVYAGRRVDLEISQQVSEARPNDTSSISSPAIFNRQISTKLTLNDGHSVLLGGLISKGQSEGTSGIPFLSSIPFIGQLFRVNSVSTDRTELLIMLVPYVIDDGEEAKDITDEIKQRLELLPVVNPIAPKPAEKSMKPASKSN